MPMMGSPKTTVASSSLLWAPIPFACSWPPLVPCGSFPPARRMSTCRCSGFGRGPVTREPQASWTWRGPVGKSCKRREFFPYLGFSPLWPKISQRLINQNPLRLKATKLMTSPCRGYKMPTSLGVTCGDPVMTDHAVDNHVLKAVDGLLESEAHSAARVAPGLDPPLDPFHGGDILAVDHIPVLEGGAEFFPGTFRPEYVRMDQQVRGLHRAADAVWTGEQGKQIIGQQKEG